jgi:hypothetical protein
MLSRKEAVLSFVDRYSPFLARQGSVVASGRQRAGRKVGPYYRLTCRDGGGIQRSIYLGSGAKLVAEVRDMLSLLQRRREAVRELARARPAFRRALRASRRELDQQLAEVGLYRKGAEIRGWKNFVPQAAAAVVPSWQASIRGGNSLGNLEK